MENSNSNKIMYKANCAVDGEEIEVPFKPDGQRPVFCKKHLAEQQSKKARQEKNNFQPEAKLVKIKPNQNHKPKRKEKPNQPIDLPPLPENNSVENKNSITKPAKPVQQINPKDWSQPLAPGERIEL